MSRRLTDAALARLTDEQLEARKDEIFEEWRRLTIQSHMMAGTLPMAYNEILTAEHRDTVMPLLGVKVMVAEIAYMRQRFARQGWMMGW